MLENEQQTEDQFEAGENNEEREEKSEYYHQPLNKGQKIAAIALALFALFIIALWSFQFQQSIRSPFQYNPDQGNAVSSEGLEVKREADLASKDTDGDGLNDYEELNVYGTSPYLEDSDSDGYDDKNEIESDNDPNCPVGVNCYGNELTAPAVIEENNTGVSADDLGTYNEMSAEETAGLETLMSGELNAATLRRILISYGMDETMLNQISDEDLLNSYKDIIQE